MQVFIGIQSFYVLLILFRAAAVSSWYVFLFSFRIFNSSRNNCIFSHSLVFSCVFMSITCIFEVLQFMKRYVFGYDLMYNSGHFFPLKIKSFQAIKNFGPPERYFLTAFYVKLILCGVDNPVFIALLNLIGSFSIFNCLFY